MTYLISRNIKLTKFTSRYVTPRYISWLNDQEVNKYLCVGRMPVAQEDVGDRNDHCNIMFGMMSNLADIHQSGVLHETETFSEYIGTISINGIDWINRKAEIGYMIGEKTHWGHGLASQAVQLASDYALHRLNLNKVEAGVTAGNIGSIRVLEKNGFKEYGIIPNEHWVDGEYKDIHRFYKMQGW